MGRRSGAVTCRLRVAVQLAAALGSLAAAAGADDPALRIELRGVDHVWHLRYPGPDGEPGGADDFIDRTDLHVPVGVPIELVVTSEDYIYRFWSPALGLNQMAIPGKVLTARFTAEQAGDYELQGEPMCGLKLDDMDSVIRVLTGDAYLAWARARAGQGTQ